MPSRKSKKKPTTSKKAQDEQHKDADCSFEDFERLVDQAVNMTSQPAPSNQKVGKQSETSQNQTRDPELPLADEDHSQPFPPPVPRKSRFKNLAELKEWQQNNKVEQQRQQPNIVDLSNIGNSRTVTAGPPRSENFPFDSSAAQNQGRSDPKIHVIQTITDSNDEVVGYVTPDRGLLIVEKSKDPNDKTPKVRPARSGEYIVNGDDDESAGKAEHGHARIASESANSNASTHIFDEYLDTRAEFVAADRDGSSTRFGPAVAAAGTSAAPPPRDEDKAESWNRQIDVLSGIVSEALDCGEMSKQAKENNFKGISSGKECLISLPGDVLIKDGEPQKNAVRILEMMGNWLPPHGKTVKAALAEGADRNKVESFVAKLANLVFDNDAHAAASSAMNSASEQSKPAIDDGKMIRALFATEFASAAVSGNIPEAVGASVYARDSIIGDCNTAKKTKIATAKAKKAAGEKKQEDGKARHGLGITNEEGVPSSTHGPSAGSSATTLTAVLAELLKDQNSAKVLNSDERKTVPITEETAYALDYIRTIGELREAKDKYYKEQGLKKPDGDANSSTNSQSGECSPPLGLGITAEDLSPPIPLSLKDVHTDISGELATKPGESKKNPAANSNNTTQRETRCRHHAPFSAPVSLFPGKRRRTDNDYVPDLDLPPAYSSLPIEEHKTSDPATSSSHEGKDPPNSKRDTDRKEADSGENDNKLVFCTCCPNSPGYGHEPGQCLPPLGPPHSSPPSAPRSRPAEPAWQALEEAKREGNDVHWTAWVNAYTRPEEQPFEVLDWGGVERRGGFDKDDEEDEDEDEDDEFARVPTPQQPQLRSSVSPPVELEDKNNKKKKNKKKNTRKKRTKDIVPQGISHSEEGKSGDAVSAIGPVRVGEDQCAQVLAVQELQVKKEVKQSAERPNVPKLEVKSAGILSQASTSASLDIQTAKKAQRQDINPYTAPKKVEPKQDIDLTLPAKPQVSENDVENASSAPIRTANSKKKKKKQKKKQSAKALPSEPSLQKEQNTVAQTKNTGKQPDPAEPQKPPTLPENPQPDQKIDIETFVRRKLSGNADRADSAGLTVGDGAIAQASPTWSALSLETEKSLDALRDEIEAWKNADGPQPGAVRAQDEENGSEQGEREWVWEEYDPEKWEQQPLEPEDEEVWQEYDAVEWERAGLDARKESCGVSPAALVADPMIALPRSAAAGTPVPSELAERIGDEARETVVQIDKPERLRWPYITNDFRNWFPALADALADPEVERSIRAGTYDMEAFETADPVHDEAGTKLVEEVVPSYGLERNTVEKQEASSPREIVRPIEEGIMKQKSEDTQLKQDTPSSQGVVTPVQEEMPISEPDQSPGESEGLSLLHEAAMLLERQSVDRDFKHSRAMLEFSSSHEAAWSVEKDEEMAEQEPEHCLLEHQDVEPPHAISGKIPEMASQQPRYTTVEEDPVEQMEAGPLLDVPEEEQIGKPKTQLPLLGGSIEDVLVNACESMQPQEVEYVQLLIMHEVAKQLEPVRRAQEDLISRMSTSEGLQKELLDRVTASEEVQDRIGRNLRSIRNGQNMEARQMTRSIDSQQVLLRRLEAGEEVQAELVRNMEASRMTQAELLRRAEASQRVQTQIVDSIAALESKVGAWVQGPGTVALDVPAGTGTTVAHEQHAGTPSSAASNEHGHGEEDFRSDVVDIGNGGDIERKDQPLIAGGEHPADGETASQETGGDEAMPDGEEQRIGSPPAAPYQHSLDDDGEYPTDILPDQLDPQGTPAFRWNVGCAWTWDDPESEVEYQRWDRQTAFSSMPSAFWFRNTSWDDADLTWELGRYKEKWDGRRSLFDVLFPTVV